IELLGHNNIGRSDPNGTDLRLKLRSFEPAVRNARPTIGSLSVATPRPLAGLALRTATPVVPGYCTV
ncbi:MAG: hypothetical protein V3T17_08110, partial [Pseudomonadales bacterium]